VVFLRGEGFKAFFLNYFMVFFRVSYKEFFGGFLLGFFKVFSCAPWLLLVMISFQT